MPFVKGFLNIVGAGGPDNSLPGGGAGIDNSLPGVEGPVDPGYGYPLPPVINNGLPSPGRPAHPIYPTYPVDPDYGLPSAPGVWPEPPIGTWPPPPPVRPSHPIYPTRPTDPDYGLDTGHRPSNELPGEGEGEEHPDQGLPGRGPRPSHPIHPGGGGAHPDHELPMPPGAVWPPLPPSVQGPVMCFVWIVGVGYRWTVIDPSLTPDQGLPGDQPEIDNTLPGRRPRPDNELPDSGNTPSNELPPTPAPKPAQHSRRGGR
jgi:hypothetical protein